MGPRLEGLLGLGHVNSFVTMVIQEGCGDVCFVRERAGQEHLQSFVSRHCSYSGWDHLPVDELLFDLDRWQDQDLQLLRPSLSRTLI